MGVDLDVLIWVIVSFVSGSITLSIFTFIIYIGNKMKYLRYWYFFWLLVTFSYIILYLSAYHNSFLLLGFFFLLMVINGFLFHAGCQEFINLKPSKNLVKFAGILTIPIMLSIAFPLWVGWGFTFTYLVYAVFVFSTALNYVKDESRTIKYTGYFMIGFSLIVLVYPFLLSSDWFLPWGYIVYGIFGLFIGVSILQLHYQKQKFELIKTQKDLLYLVHHDPLTNVYNRTFINEVFDKINTEKTENIGLIFIDLNNFKKINDDFGHKKGDEILINIANSLKSLIADSGYFCRFGGDEFIIIVYDANEEIIEMLQNKITDFAIDYSNNGIGISLALGNAIRKDCNQDIHDLLDIAEKEMYVDKRQFKQSKNR